MARQKAGKNSPNFAPPAKPAHLSQQASAEWDRLMSEIEASGLKITPAHRALITLAATLAADIKADFAELQSEGAYSVSPKGGIVAHPALKRMDALRRDLIKTLSAIGLRPGLTTEPSEGGTLADLLADED